MGNKLFIFAGEKGGDLLGSHLLKGIRKKLPHCTLEGVGGPEMRSEPFQCMMRTEEFEILGFSDILWSIPKLRNQFKTIRQHILHTKPDGVIFIDYPGFNLKMAASLRKHGYKGKLIQYISPTIWAWGANRKGLMETTHDLLLTIYPFEEKYYEGSPLRVKYVGNPIKEIIDKHHYDQDWAKLFGIKEPENLVAIFPGSRKGEIQLNLPYQLKAAEMLKKTDSSAKFAISCAHDKIIPVMHSILCNNSLKLNKDIFLLPKGYSYELMRNCRCAIAKSGTVTLELALHQCPSVVIYKLSLLNRFIARYIMRLKLPHYCIVNILKNKTVFPELIEKGLTPQNIFHHTHNFYRDTKEREECLRECKQIPNLLQDQYASEIAAEAIKEILQ